MDAGVPNNLRPELWHWNEQLGAAADHLWKVSKEIHDRQNVKGDPNEYGRIHVESVEYNIWRLLFDPHGQAEFVEKNKEEAKAKPYEIFLLSAAACCHDFDKADKLPRGIRHGEQSGEIVRKLKDYLGLNDSQVEDIRAVISIHGIDDANKFKKALRDLPTEKQFEHGTFNLQRLALLLEAADILHLDRSRISPAMSRVTDWKHLPKEIKQKCLFRSHTRGWGIQGKAIHVEMGDVGNAPPLQRQLERCFEWIKKNEWSAVSEHLQAIGFPYKLDIDFGDVPPSQQKGRQCKYIPVKAKRYISETQARQFLCTSLKPGTKYPICRNCYTTHAAGVVTARLSLLALVKKMESFKINFDTNANEFILETDCILSKLCEHFTRLSNAQSLFKQLVEDDALSGSFENSLKDTIGALPTGRSFYEHLSIFRREFESNLEDMRKRLTPKISEITDSNMTERKQREALESAKWLTDKDPDIKDWFVQKKTVFSDVILDLEKAFQALHPMLTPIQNDWDKDYALIQRQEEGMHKIPILFTSKL